MSRKWFVTIGVGFSVLGCVGDVAPSFDADSTSTEPDVSAEIASCGPDECQADNACRVDGEVNPQNPCEVCDPTRTRTDWSPALVDTPCDDGDNCTGSGTCNDGLCMPGEPTDVCAVTAECVEVCDLWCNLVVTEGTCFIDGVCHGAGDAAPGDDCRTCQPERSQLAWSGTNADCDDGNGCTYADTCTDNGCEGVINLCDDGRACTSDFCDGGVCQNPITDGCLFDETCVATNASLPETPCMVCKPDVSRTTPTVVDEGPCDDGNACTTVSTCQDNGGCSGAIASIEAEPNDIFGAAISLGSASGDGFPSGSIAANLLHTGDVDVFRWGISLPTGQFTLVPRARVMNIATPIELCVFATCSQTSQTAAAPVVVCPPGTVRGDLGSPVTAGCCRSIGDGEGALELEALCVTVSTGIGYAVVRPTADTDADSCGGYELQWGNGR